MPIKDEIVYIDNTYMRDVATCSTRGFLLRVLGLVATEANKDAAHMGSCFHRAIEAHHKSGGDKQTAVLAFHEAYDEYFGVGS